MLVMFANLTGSKKRPSPYEHALQSAQAEQQMAHWWLSTMPVMGDHKAATHRSAGSFAFASFPSSHSSSTCSYA
jgi:hypothetical protein